MLEPIDRGSEPIPLVASHRTGREEEYLLSAMAQRSLGAGGVFTTRCERFLESLLNVPRAFLTSSCTAALHLAGQAIGLGPGDEIIVPSFSFASCASVFASLGAGIVFADSKTDTLNIDEDHVERLIGPRTRALLVVHYAGRGCNLDALTFLAERAGITLIEDCAHALFGDQGGRALGTFGRLAAFSFDHAKNVTCGEGGALAVNDPSLLDRVEVAYERGTNRAELRRGEATTYKWLAAGGNYGASELQAAFLLAQLEAWREIQARRRAVWETYMESLESWAAVLGVSLPVRPAEHGHAYHLFPVLLPDPSARGWLIRYLAAKGVQSAPHYFPLHLSPGASLLGRVDACSQVEDFHGRLLRLPLHAELTTADVRRVTSALTDLQALDAVATEASIESAGVR